MNPDYLFPVTFTLMALIQWLQSRSDGRRVERTLRNLCEGAADIGGAGSPRQILEFTPSVSAVLEAHNSEVFNIQRARALAILYLEAALWSLTFSTAHGHDSQVWNTSLAGAAVTVVLLGVFTIGRARPLHRKGSSRVN
ncbi:MAG TPA: hypothetical protein VFJ58_09475 [Armatimonadota bacterium]|nr:hypothetical protein [Armatimonadota bacterium]